MKPQEYLGRVGIWTLFDGQPTGLVRDAVAELDSLGYGALFYGEAFGRDALTQAPLWLESSEKMVVTSGVANIFFRHPMAAVATVRTLRDAYGDRFLLGLGGHRTTDQPAMMGMPFHGNAVDVMREYLTTMDSIEPTRRVLAALGPKMLALAAELSWGAHTYFVPPEHTARAREILGPDALLAVEQTVVLGGNRELAEKFVAPYFRARHQVLNLRRLGYDRPDSPGLVDALVAIGDLDTIAKRVEEHLAAGADHVCIQVLTEDPAELPLRQWRELASLL
ncbi:MAG: TIGR03620 family F420-dependent LLM class oxidoreductase [Kibdelosporangium sp.]